MKRGYINESRHRDEYSAQGFTLIPDVVPEPDVWRRAIVDSPDLTAVLDPKTHRQRHRALDRFQIDSVLPALASEYDSLLALVRAIADDGAILSPFTQSAYYAMVYEPPNGPGEWHFDSNDITGILYLTSHLHSGGTRITSLRDNTQQTVAPRAGALLLFQGSKCWHRGEAVLNEPKVICLLNYYAGTPAMRPQELDFLIFGK